MTQPTPARRRLAWGPFAVGTTVTILFALLSLWLIGLCDGHWYRNAVAIFFGVVLMLLAASAGMALFDRKAPTS